MAGVQSAIRRLPVVCPRPIQLLAELTHQFPFGPGEAIVVDGDGKHTLIMPAIALDLLGIPASAAVAFRIPPCLMVFPGSRSKGSRCPPGSGRTAAAVGSHPPGSFGTVRA
jgi:hypothetical protein